MNSTKDTVIKVEEHSSQSRESINILCLDITSLRPLMQFFACCFFIFLCYLAYGYFLEEIFSNPDVKPVSLYITLIQFLITTALSFVESMFRVSTKRKVPLKTYAILAALTLGTMSLSNLALSYLNYPTQLIFKSCKLIPVMAGSIIILGKKYGFLDYLAAVVMCIGLTMFTLADSQTSPNFDSLGVLVISLALLCDAIIGNVQEKAMKQFQATNNEVVFYSYAIASGYLIVITFSTGIMIDGFYYCAKNSIKMYTNIFLLSVSGFMGLQAVLTLVRICGATVAVTVTTMRKVFSIVISFLLFSKPFVFQYVWSGMLVALAIFLNHYSKKNPNYLPSVLSHFCYYLKRFYASEYKYLRIKSKMYADTV